METKFEFRGTGGELFKQLFVGLLLCSVTFGIYMPWFLVSLQKMVVQKTFVRSGDRELRLDFTGTGGELFKQTFLSYLFTMWTFGIYAPWAMVRLLKFQLDNMVAVDEERTYRFHTEITGGELFKNLALGFLLLGVTFGIYAPWFVAKLVKTVVERTELRANDEPIGIVSFKLTGGELFKTFIVAYLLTGITFGIYLFWAQVKIWKLFAQSLEIEVEGRTYRGDFTGTGGENFKVNFLGYLFTMWTFGIYSFWYIANLLRFQLSNISFAPQGEMALADGMDMGMEQAVVRQPVSRAIAQPQMVQPQQPRQIRAPSAPLALPAPVAERRIPVAPSVAQRPATSQAQRPASQPHYPASQPNYAAQLQYQEPQHQEEPQYQAQPQQQYQTEPNYPVSQPQRPVTQPQYPTEPNYPVSQPQRPASQAQRPASQPHQAVSMPSQRAPSVPVQRAPSAPAPRASMPSQRASSAPAPRASMPSHRASSAPAPRASMPPHRAQPSFRSDPYSSGDRRAAWARAFLPPLAESQLEPQHEIDAEAPAPAQQAEWQATIADHLNVGVGEVWTDTATPRAPGVN